MLTTDNKELAVVVAEEPSVPGIGEVGMYFEWIELVSQVAYCQR